MENNAIREGVYFYVDSNNNMWSKEKYTQGEALLMSESLINCNDCIDCQDCKDCSYCIDCINCENCKECKECKHCINQINCNNLFNNETTCQNKEYDDFKLLIDKLNESNENLVSNQHIITLAISDLQEAINRIEQRLQKLES